MTESRDIAVLLAHQRPLLALARTLGRPDADDLVQDALCEGLGRGPSGRGLGAWLRRAVISRAIDRARADRRRRGREALAARPESLPSTADLVEREQLRRRVAEAVIALDEPYRSTVWQRFFDDRSVREIARAAGVPEKTVHTRLRRALAQLRGRLDGEYRDRRAWLALLPIAAHIPTPTAIAAGVSMKKLIAGVAVLALLWLGLDTWWWRAAGEEPPTPVAEAMRSHEVESAKPGAAPPARAAVPAPVRPSERTVTVVYPGGHPAAHLDCWPWPERPRWTWPGYASLRIPLPRETRPELFFVGAHGSPAPGRRDTRPLLERAPASTDTRGRAQLAPDVVGLTVRVEPHLFVTFDVSGSGAERLELPAFADVPVHFVGTQPDDRLTLRCAPVFRSPRTSLNQDVPLLTQPVTTRSGEAMVSIAAFALVELAPRDLSFQSLPGVEYEIEATGLGVEMRGTRRRGTAPEPVELVFERHEGGVEVAIVETDGTLARDARGIVWWRHGVEGRKQVWFGLFGGTALVNLPSVRYPVDVEIEAWLADGERFRRSLLMEEPRCERVELVRGEGEVRLAIELPEPDDPCDVVIETASGDLVDCREEGRSERGPGWLVAADGTVTLRDAGEGWRRILVVTRSGRVACVLPPASGRVTARWLPHTELTPLDVAEYASTHAAKSLLVEFGIRLRSATGAETWVWPDVLETDDPASAPPWHKWAPTECEYRFGAQSGSGALPEPRVARR